jgi:uncharacterized delta-60 repeat protein
MKKIFVLLLVITLIPIHCSKKKQNNLLWLLLLLNNSNSFNNSSNSNDNNSNDNNSINIIGVIDTSFGNNGTQIIPISGTNNNDEAYSIAIQNGKILLGGKCRLAEGPPPIQDFCIARLNLDGTLDASFGNSGKITYDSGYNHDVDSYSIQVLSDGSILQTGTCDNAITGDYDFFITKLDSNGNNFDPTYLPGSGKNGKLIPIYGFDNAYTSYVKNNDIFIGGSCEDQFCIAKLYINNANLDNSFGSNGKVTIDMVSSGSGYEEIHSLIVDNNNKIYAGGWCDDGSKKFCLARFNSNGSLDTSFGSSGKVNGKVIEDISSGNDEAYAMVLQPDGKILLGGYCNDGGEKFCLARFNSNGTLDTSFGSSGKVIEDISSGDDEAHAMVLQPDGKILLGGFCVDGSKKFCLARFNSNGTLDTSFGNNGKVIQDISNGDDYGYSMIIYEGKIYMGGYCVTSSGNSDFCIARFK